MVSPRLPASLLVFCFTVLVAAATAHAEPCLRPYVDKDFRLTFEAVTNASIPADGEHGGIEFHERFDATVTYRLGPGGGSSDDVIFVLASEQQSTLTLDERYHSANGTFTEGRAGTAMGHFATPADLFIGTFSMFGENSAFPCSYAFTVRNEVGRGIHSIDEAGNAVRPFDQWFSVSMNGAFVHFTPVPLPAAGGALTGSQTVPGWLPGQSVTFTWTVNVSNAGESDPGDGDDGGNDGGGDGDGGEGDGGEGGGGGDGDGHGGAGGACVVSGVEWQPLGPALLPNPDAAGSGWRLFADGDVAADVTPKQVSLVISGAPNSTAIYRVWDMPRYWRDASIDRLGSPGDNIGDAAGTVDVRRVDLGAAGEAHITFTPAPHPGNNYRVAATCNEAALTALVADGLALVPSSPTPGGDYTTSSLLTVWRRVNIEVDSMRPPQRNYLDARIIASQAMFAKDGAAMLLTVDRMLPFNRFAEGRIGFGSGYSIKSRIISNTDRKLVVAIAGSSPAAGQTIRLWDDDDFNGDGDRNGDEGQPLPLPDRTLLAERSDDKSKNVLAPAYMWPVYDSLTPLNLHPGVEFVENIDGSSPEATHAHLQRLFSASCDSCALNAPGFWVIYLTSGYQGRDELDGDPALVSTAVGPSEEFGLTGWTDDAQTTRGSLVFLETLSAHERAAFNKALAGYGRALGRAFTPAAAVAHEVGHALGVTDPDPDDPAPAGLMSHPTAMNVAAFTEAQILQLIAREQ